MRIHLIVHRGFSPLVKVWFQEFPSNRLRGQGRSAGGSAFASSPEMQPVWANPCAQWLLDADCKLGPSEPKGGLLEWCIPSRGQQLGFQQKSTLLLPFPSLSSGLKAVWPCIKSLKWRRSCAGYPTCTWNHTVLEKKPRRVSAVFPRIYKRGHKWRRRVEGTDSTAHGPQRQGLTRELGPSSLHAAHHPCVCLRSSFP